MSHPKPDSEFSAHRQYEAEHTDPGRNKSVAPYLAILVAVAFLLLLIAYLMQLRIADTAQGLSESVNTIKSFDQLAVENRSLRDQLDALEAENADLEQQLGDARSKLGQLQSEIVSLQQQLASAEAPEASPSPSSGQ